MCVCASGIHLYVQMLSLVSAKSMREKHFDRFSSRPRRGSLDVTTTLHRREKTEGRIVIAKSVGDAGAKACLCVFSFFPIVCAPKCLHPVQSFTPCIVFSLCCTCLHLDYKYQIYLQVWMINKIFLIGLHPSEVDD